MYYSGAVGLRDWQGSVLWAHIPFLALVSYISNRSKDDFGNDNQLGRHIGSALEVLPCVCLAILSFSFTSSALQSLAATARHKKPEAP